MSINMAVLEHYPELTEAMVKRDRDIMSHGIYNTRFRKMVSIGPPYQRI